MSRTLEEKTINSIQKAKKSRANHCTERPWLIKHGESRTRLYQIYADMKTRCYNPNDKFYKDYGGRGITIDKRWEQYVSFAKWAKANGYSDELTIERIDVDGNYSPENCTWVTKRKQCFNRRTNHFITYKGEKITLSELCERTGIAPKTIIRYEKKGNYDYDSIIEKVLNSPYHKIHLGKRRKGGKK